MRILCCAECNKEFQAKTAHQNRKFCAEPCKTKSAKRTYNSKPENKAKKAAQMREKRRLHPKRTQRPPVVCLHCRTAFAQRQFGRAMLFCSVKCKDREKVQRISGEKFAAYLSSPARTPCATCGTEFKPPYQGPRQKYCSPACGLAPKDKRRRALETRLAKEARLARQAANVARIARLFRLWREHGQSIPR